MELLRALVRASATDDLSADFLNDVFVWFSGQQNTPFFSADFSSEQQKKSDDSEKADNNGQNPVSAASSSSSSSSSCTSSSAQNTREQRARSVASMEFLQELIDYCIEQSRVVSPSATQQADSFSLFSLTGGNKPMGALSLERERSRSGSGCRGGRGGGRGRGKGGKGLSHRERAASEDDDDAGSDQEEMDEEEGGRMPAKMPLDSRASDILSSQSDASDSVQMPSMRFLLTLLKQMIVGAGVFQDDANAFNESAAMQMMK